MTKKNYTSIPILIGIILIPQLLFWWLAPQRAKAFYIAYIGMTLVTTGIPVACFLTNWKSCIRQSAGLFIIGSFLEILAMGVTTWILAINATFRSALFAYTIMILAITIIMIPMISGAIKKQRQGVLPFDTTDRQPEPTTQETSCRNAVSRPTHTSVPHRTTGQIRTAQALPPRNR